MTPSTLLQQMRAAYERAESYADTGRYVRLEGAGATAAEGSFTTRFARATGLLAFEFSLEDGGLALAGSYTAERGQLVARGGCVPADALNPAVAVDALAGVFPPAHFVPRLLLPGLVGGRALWDAVEPTMKATVPIDGQPCFVLDVGSPHARLELALGTDDLLIRRVCIPNLELSAEVLAEVRKRAPALDPQVLQAWTPQSFVASYVIE